jgi:hypothetical protein
MKARPGAPAFVQFADGDLKLARGKLDRQVRTWLAAARIAALNLRRSRPAHLGHGVHQSLEVPAARGICGRETCCVDGKRAALSEARKILRQACHILTELGDDALSAA